MRIHDGHTHLSLDRLRDTSDDVATLLAKLEATGISAAVVICSPPPSMAHSSDWLTDRQRIGELMTWRQGRDEILPFYWIDPIARDAEQQVDWAIEQGMVGFKIVCDRFHVYDPVVMRTVRAIADRDKCILFHSGILWDGKPSAHYNKPSEFEALLTIPKLRFSLAHVSWPWCDECIAVYGKFLNALTVCPGQPAEMFIDLSPGTPVLYRREVFRKLFQIGYDVRHNILFGTDAIACDYNASWTENWLKLDNQLYHEMGLGQDMLEHIYERNLRRFIFNDPPTVERALPQQAMEDDASGGS